MNRRSLHPAKRTKELDGLRVILLDALAGDCGPSTRAGSVMEQRSDTRAVAARTHEAAEVEARCRVPVLLAVEAVHGGCGRAVGESVGRTSCPSEAGGAPASV